MSDNYFVVLIQRAKEAIGLTDLADYLGVSKPTILRWCNGQSLACEATREAIRSAIETYLTR